MHNKDIELQMNTILAALNLLIDELYVHQEEVEKMQEGSSQKVVQAEVDKHLELTNEAKDLVREWAHKLDQAISTKVF